MSTSSHEGFLLRHQPSGENGLRLEFLTPQEGVLTLWKRAPGKSSLMKGHFADLFSHCALTAAPDASGHPRFVREIRILHAYPGISETYRSLHYASRMARIILENPFHEEHPGTLFVTFAKALDAWASGSAKCPEWTYLKSLYLYAREEGLPVEQEWRRQLLPDLNAELSLLLRTPVASTAPRPALLQLLRERLEDYLQHTGDLRL